MGIQLLLFVGGSHIEKGYGISSIAEGKDQQHMGGRLGKLGGLLSWLK
jgi:hypothetical protein